MEIILVGFSMILIILFFFVIFWVVTPNDSDARIFAGLFCVIFTIVIWNQMISPALVVYQANVNATHVQEVEKPGG